MRTLAFIVMLSLAGCAGIEKQEGTFIACRAGDLITTKLAIIGGLHEANPIAMALMGHGWIPLIGVNLAIIYFAHQYWKTWNDNERMIANAASCAPALWNTSVIFR